MPWLLRLSVSGPNRDNWGRARHHACLSSHLLTCYCAAVPFGSLMIKLRGIFVSILHPPFYTVWTLHCGIDAPTGNTNLNLQDYQVKLMLVPDAHGLFGTSVYSWYCERQQPGRTKTMQVVVHHPRKEKEKENRNISERGVWSVLVSKPEDVAAVWKEIVIRSVGDVGPAIPFFCRSAVELRAKAHPHIKPPKVQGHITSGPALLIGRQSCMLHARTTEVLTIHQSILLKRSRGNPNAATTSISAHHQVTDSRIGRGQQPHHAPPSAPTKATWLSGYFTESQ